ncbi:uncharacterized protein LOC129596696 [Paramacrobiotus metropolitanus]|uniref:uncharacterized protein LOC129596696 n=1 Tax=Paramacrobiotus metropolitanus TaxID=2943436 RepID=UPI002445D9B1|nr:uncharacterized protein LOC129596696 [Paramacrobiotus metropolitanus]XP_055350014.1 uncharacterized protein LOC129596696 [Paramacrobiotus metropolitanus]XP_055350015.1 uncharacterized protein LOC129596696 [Paramacrobiotus metropolitanus]
MASHGTPAQSIQARFAQWIHKPWKSLPLPLLRSKDIPSNDTYALELFPEHGDLDTIPADSNYRQILGKKLHPVVYEGAAGQLSLGYVCDVDWPGCRVLVDFVCRSHPPRWVPFGKVRRHRNIRSYEVNLKAPVSAALRLSSDQPFVFQPVRIISPDCYADSGLIYVETVPPERAVPIRKFIRPIQLRGVPKYPQNYLPTDESLSVQRYCQLLREQTARLIPGKKAEDVDLQRLLRALNDIPWMKVVRIWVDAECVHCVYTNIKPGILGGKYLDGLVFRSYHCHANPPGVFPGFDNADVRQTHSTSLGMLPYELQERIVLDIQDFHSVVSAQRVCQIWYDILNSHLPYQHVAVDLRNLLPDCTSGQERTYNRTHLINVLDHAVTTSTVSLMLVNGSVDSDLELCIYRFVSLKRICLPMIVLKNVRCIREAGEIYGEKKQLKWANLSHLSLACHVLYLRDVTIPTPFRSIARLWSSTTRFPEDDEIVVDNAALHCTPNKADRLQQFLRILDANCPELTASEWDDINEAYHAIMTSAVHPFHSRLVHLLKLLHEPVTGQLQAPLSRLAAHAFRYCGLTEEPFSGSHQYSRLTSRNYNHIYHMPSVTSGSYFCDRPLQVGNYTYFSRLLD